MTPEDERVDASSDENVEVVAPDEGVDPDEENDEIPNPADVADSSPADQPYGGPTLPKDVEALILRLEHDPLAAYETDALDMLVRLEVVDPYAYQFAVDFLYRSGVRRKDLERHLTLHRRELRRRQKTHDAKVLAEAGAVPGDQPKFAADPKKGMSATVRDRTGVKRKVPIANFCARILDELLLDDGVATTRVFNIWANVRGDVENIRVAARDFRPLAWVHEQLGARAIIYEDCRERVGIAIQELSGRVARVPVYIHTGWRRLGDDSEIYIHSTGAITAGPPGEDPDASSPQVLVELSPGLAKYALPAPTTDADELRAGIESVLRLVKLTRRMITVPLIAMVFRAPLGGAEYVLWIVGASGCFKSELSALAQQFYGAGLDRLNLPLSWSSTANAIEVALFTLKDMVAVIDDFAPRGNMSMRAELDGKADRVIRSVGNRSSRQRLGADRKLEADRPPRATVIASGEDLPSGLSTRGRMVILEMRRGEVTSEALAACQNDAAAGAYAQVMSSYVLWLSARRRDGSQQDPRRRGAELRSQVSLHGVHGRTAGNVADLTVGWETFLTFATEVGAIDESTRSALWDEGWTALVELGAAQGVHLTVEEPAERFLVLLRSAVAAARAHLVGSKGEPPSSPARWGWRRASTDLADWSAGGDRIGWVVGEDVYLDADAAYRVVQSHGGDRALAVSCETLLRRLEERGQLASVEPGRQRVRRVLQHERRWVVHVRWGEAPDDVESVQADAAPVLVDAPDDVESVVGEGPDDFEFVQDEAPDELA